MPDKLLTDEEFNRLPDVDTVPVEKGPVSKPFKDEDFPEYVRLVQSASTTPEQLSSWLEGKGYGVGTNTDTVLAWHKKNPKTPPTNNFLQRVDPLNQGGDTTELQLPGGVTGEKVPEERDFGLDPETARALGWDDPFVEGIDPASRVARFLKSTPAMLADAGVSTLQVGQALVDAVAESADDTFKGSWLDDKVTEVMGVHQRPSELIGGVPEAFPLGGLELGGIRPTLRPSAAPSRATQIAQGVEAAPPPDVVDHHQNPT
jgi:hypothetical protein